MVPPTSVNQLCQIHIFSSSNRQSQWIGLREHLQENPMIFMGKLMVSCRFSLKPIHWQRLAIHQLLSSGLADASELLLGGCSAGAVAAPLLGDHVAQTVRRAAAQRGRLKNGGNGGNAEVDLWWFMAIYGDLCFFLWYVMVLVQFLLILVDFGGFLWFMRIYGEVFYVDVYGNVWWYISVFVSRISWWY